MGRDEQYQCIVFEQFVLLVPNFLSILSEMHKNVKAFEAFAAIVSLSSYMHPIAYQNHP